MKRGHYFRSFVAPGRPGAGRKGPRAENANLCPKRNLALVYIDETCKDCPDYDLKNAYFHKGCMIKEREARERAERREREE